MTNSQIVKQVKELLTTLQQRMKNSPVETFTFIAVVTPDAVAADEEFVSLGGGGAESQMNSIMLAMALDPQAAITFLAATENFRECAKPQHKSTLMEVPKAQA